MVGGRDFMVGSEFWGEFWFFSGFSVAGRRDFMVGGRDFMVGCEIWRFSGRPAGILWSGFMVGAKIPDWDGGSPAHFGCEATAWDLHDRQAAF